MNKYRLFPDMRSEILFSIWSAFVVWFWLMFIFVPQTLGWIIMKVYNALPHKETRHKNVELLKIPDEFRQILFNNSLGGVHG